MTRSTPPARELRPEHALLTPTWLGALALLIANDHWLKGSGLLPGVLTGKLSDFAGMLVAPVLLASLLRVGTRRGLLICHVAVVVVFSGIQLSRDFADLWSSLMGLFGYPWVITCDPTDLIALPFAWLSLRMLTPAMDPERPALVGLRRSAVAAASVFGLWATVATSDDSSSDDGCWDCWSGTDTGDGGTEGGDGDGWQDISGDVYIHNPNEFDISVTIRTLSSDVWNLDCEAIANDPSRLLPDDAFGPAEHWLLPPTTNVAIGMNFGCGAAKVGGEGIPEQIVFSTDLQFDGGWGGQSFPGSHASLDELDPLGAAIVMGPEGASWIGGDSWRHTPKTDTAPQPEQCLPEPDERRIDWSELHGDPIVQVLAKTAGLDGCYEIELSPWLSDGFGPSFIWYLCAPESSVRLEVGSHYQLVSEAGSAYTVEARLVDPVSFLPLQNELGHALFTARWARGEQNAALITELPVTHLDAPTCPWAVAEDCPIVERKLGLSLDGEALDVGVTEVHVDPIYRHEFTLSRARAVGLVHASCAHGSFALPHAIDYALITEALIP